jgi:Dihydrouridine synthase (Dus)
MQVRLELVCFLLARGCGIGVCLNHPCPENRGVGTWVSSAAAVSLSQGQPTPTPTPHQPQGIQRRRPKAKQQRRKESRERSLDDSTVDPIRNNNSQVFSQSPTLSTAPPAWQPIASTATNGIATKTDIPSCLLLPALPHPHRYILAPMVGASELPFRLLCRRYGADVCYTPMMDATQFACSASYRAGYHLQSTVHIADRPLVAHG